MFLPDLSNATDHFPSPVMANESVKGWVIVVRVFCAKIILPWRDLVVFILLCLTALESLLSRPCGFPQTDLGSNMVLPPGQATFFVVLYLCYQH